jgi:8-oxo-dGTP diphosphatase
MTFRNPLPVGVVLVPYDGGLIVTRRADPRTRGKLGLPGGYLNVDEPWDVGAAREFYEETGAYLNPGDIRLTDIVSATGHFLVFGTYRGQVMGFKPQTFENDPETMETLVIYEPVQLAFYSHTRMAEQWFANERQKNK